SAGEKLMGQVDEEKRRLDLDPDQGDESDGGGEGQSLARQEERHEPSRRAERDDRGDDECRAEGAELQDQNGEDREHGDDDRAPDAAETLLAALDLSGWDDAISGWQGKALQPAQRLARDTVRVEPRAHVRRDCDASLAVVALHFGHGSVEADV